MKALAVVLLVLLGLGVLADRVAMAIAEGQVARQLAAQSALAGPPDVDIRGFPFLTQAVGGRYEDVRISLDAETLGRREGTQAEVALTGVWVPLSAVLSGQVQEVPVERIDGTATLSYALLSDELGGDTVLRREGDGLRITRTVELLGRSVPLTAAGTVALDGDELVIDVERASGAGLPVPDELVERANDLLDLRYPIELPFGLRLLEVQPAEDGVDVRVEAVDTVLAAE
ncbi:DUF2993 domain-containing protein [Blastococcus montanus]|uniref:LmeA family phospholipid-binding protein n=1 Tax=Blastococcus montanus TaxID=3144973 RepID=UPI00320B3123